jgi:Protein of unknown function (DUF4446)
VDAIALALAVVALVTALMTLGWVLRSGGNGPDMSPSAARSIDLERHLLAQGQRLQLVEHDVDALRAGQVGAARPVSNAIRGTGSAITHVGLVRFDAFDDTGGGQSFVLALIDDDGDGVILTSLHSRTTTRLFVKDVRGGVADAPLSGEEERALGEAGLVG